MAKSQSMSSLESWLSLAPPEMVFFYCAGVITCVWERWVREAAADRPETDARLCVAATARVLLRSSLTVDSPSKRELQRTCRSGFNYYSDYHRAVVGAACIGRQLRKWTRGRNLDVGSLADGVNRVTACLFTAPPPPVDHLDGRTAPFTLSSWVPWPSLRVVWRDKRQLMRYYLTVEPKISPREIFDLVEASGEAGLIACDIVGERGLTPSTLAEIASVLPKEAQHGQSK